jgi:hypothetical protein
MQNRTFRADDRLNQLSDRDELWGPLLFLRPERSRLMSVPRVLTLSALVGGFFGMFGSVLLAFLLTPGDPSRPPVLMMPALMTAMYFALAELSFVPAWNRRARLIMRRQDWAELTGRPLPPPRDDEPAAE